MVFRKNTPEEIWKQIKAYPGESFNAGSNDSFFIPSIENAAGKQDALFRSCHAASASLGVYLSNKTGITSGIAQVYSNGHAKNLVDTTEGIYFLDYTMGQAVIGEPNKNVIKEDFYFENGVFFGTPKAHKEIMKCAFQGSSKDEYKQKMFLLSGAVGDNFSALKTDASSLRILSRADELTSNDVVLTPFYKKSSLEDQLTLSDPTRTLYIFQELDRFRVSMDLSDEFSNQHSKFSIRQSRVLQIDSPSPNASQIYEQAMINLTQT